MNDNEPEVEIVDRVPSQRRSSKAPKFNLGDYVQMLGRRYAFDSRLFRFGLLLIIFVGLFDISGFAAYVLSASVYGWKLLDDSVIYLRHYIPKKLYLMLTLKSAFYFLILVFLSRLVFGVLIGWLVMPVSILLSLRYGNISKAA